MNQSYFISFLSIGFLISIFVMTTTSINGQTEFKEYVSEPIGVKLQIPTEWTIFNEKNDSKSCVNPISLDRLNAKNELERALFSCDVHFNNDELGDSNYTLTINKYSFSGSLKDFVTYMYNNLELSWLNPTYLDDKEIILHTYPSWQMEYTRETIFGEELKNMDIYTKINNTFYRITYYSDEISDYSKFLPEIQNIIKTIEFLPFAQLKKPSFLD